jgi:hypothetical protein
MIPTNREYHIGDTITIKSIFHKEVTAFNSNGDEIGPFDMDGIKWKPATTIFRTDTINQGGISSIGDYFTFLKNDSFNYVMFSASNHVTALDGEYNYKNDTFSLEIRLIARRVGTFFLRQESGVFAGHGEQQDFPGRCGRDGFDVWVDMNNGTENNIDLLKESPDSLWNTLILRDPETNFYRWGGYCFKVTP